MNTPPLRAALAPPARPITDAEIRRRLGRIAAALDANRQRRQAEERAAAEAEGRESTT